MDTLDRPPDKVETDEKGRQVVSWILKPGEVQFGDEVLPPIQQSAPLELRWRLPELYGINRKKDELYRRFKDMYNGEGKVAHLKKWFPEELKWWYDKNPHMFPPIDLLLGFLKDTYPHFTPKEIVKNLAHYRNLASQLIGIYDREYEKLTKSNRELEAKKALRIGEKIALFMTKYDERFKEYQQIKEQELEARREKAQAKKDRLGK